MAVIIDGGYPDPVEMTREIQGLAIKVCTAGNEVTRDAARFCNVSMGTVRKWATGHFDPNKDIRNSVGRIAKSGMVRALDEHRIV